MCRDKRRCSNCNNSGCCNKCETIMRYIGPDIDCVGIATGDTYETVTGKLSDFICNNLGVDGEDGVGISDMTYNPETDTMTIDMTDGTSKLITGLKGPKGDPGESLGIIDSTYGNLTVLRDSNSLVKGQLYLMTDFQTIYDQPDYSDVDTPKTSVVTKAAPVDPIILFAISTTEFAKEVWRPSTPRHTLEYDINFSQTEVMGAPAKGRITYCKDEFNNETHYDHTVVLLKRYESVSGSGVFNSFWDTGFGSTEVLTFGTESFSNKIGDNYYELGGHIEFAISNNVFGDNTEDNTFGNITRNNTFGDGTENNTFGKYTRNNTFGDWTMGNTFGSTYNNTFGDNTEDNTFGNGTNSNTFGNDTYFNTFGNITRNNTFGDGTYNNIFGNAIQGIDFTITPTPIHIYGIYPCNIFKRQDGTVRLSYYDNTDTLLVVDPTD